MQAADIIYFAVACVLAMLLGVFLAKRQARTYRTQNRLQHMPHQQGSKHLPAVTFLDHGDMRFLHLATPAVQGSMKISKPCDIHLDYVQRMMGWLLFVNLDHVQHMHAMQLGLGAAALTKFCHVQLGMQTTAVELNPAVVATCREWFHLPTDNAKLHVLVGDAGEVVKQAQWFEKVDVLQVDLYDQEAACPVLDSEDFYRDCRHLLTHNGCMSVNIFGHASSLPGSLEKIKSVFGQDCVWSFKPTRAGNAIVLAFRSRPEFDAHALAHAASNVQARWNLPATSWLGILNAPVNAAMA